MLTLLIRYSINPNKIADFKAYVAAELGPIRQSGGDTLGYFLPTDFAGPTNEAFGLIRFSTLAAYEKYRSILASDPEHQKNVARLEENGSVLATHRSIVRQVEEK
jgi:hypothetical protein